MAGKPGKRQKKMKTFVYEGKSRQNGKGKLGQMISLMDELVLRTGALIARAKESLENFRKRSH